MKPTNASSGSSTLALKKLESADLPTEPVDIKTVNDHITGTLLHFHYHLLLILEVRIKLSVYDHITGSALPLPSAAYKRSANEDTDRDRYRENLS